MEAFLQGESVKSVGVAAAAGANTYAEGRGNG